MKVEGVYLSIKIPLPLLLVLFLREPLLAQNNGSSKYVVLKVTNVGKISHKPLAEKEQDSFRKDLEKKFQEAKRAFQEEKKEFEKNNPGKKFDKAEPQRPRFTVVKRDVKSKNEAMKIASDLDKELEKAKNGKNGKNGNGNGKGTGNSDGGEKGTGKDSSG